MLSSFLYTTGNDAIAVQDYNAAVRLYTEAIELCPDGVNTHIYYSNRAAAHCYLTSYELAIEDCDQCIALSPNYVKGYTRLGQAYSGMKDYDNAIEAFKKCVELEPKNKGHKDALSQAKQKKLEHRGQQMGGSSAGNGGSSGAFDMDALKGGMPGGSGGLASMMQNPSVMKAAQDMMGKSGGLEGMMKNPQMMKMAQQMMSNPQLMQQAMSMLGQGGAGGAGGGAGGMPDLSALAGMMGGEGGGMPDMSALAGMMGGADAGAGGRPAGGGFFDEETPPTSSSNGKGKKGKGGSSSSGR